MAKNLFNGYKEVVVKTRVMVNFVESCQVTGLDMAKIFTNLFAGEDAKEVKKYMHILRALGVRITKRKGVWYLNGKKVEL